MGRIVRFRKGRRWKRWTTPKAYGVKPARFHRKPKTWRQAWFETRPYIFLIALVTLALVWQTPGFYEPPRFLQTAPEPVDGEFTYCGPGRGEYCVIDGDTFKLGERKVRVAGIDTAEKDARCPEEAMQADASTGALLDWLNRGPFQMTARIDEPTDKYGRDLRFVKRVAADGSEDRLAEWMRAEGGARGYSGGFRRGWC